MVTAAAAVPFLTSYVQFNVSEYVSFPAGSWLEVDDGADVTLVGIMERDVTNTKTAAFSKSVTGLSSYGYLGTNNTAEGSIVLSGTAKNFGSWGANSWKVVAARGFEQGSVGGAAWSTANTGNPSLTTRTPFIGALKHSPAIRYYDGGIVAIWSLDKKLSDAEIADLQAEVTLLGTLFNPKTWAAANGCAVVNGWHAGLYTDGSPITFQNFGDSPDWTDGTFQNGVLGDINAWSP